MTHKKFTQTERELLSQWGKEGAAKKECARRLGRDIRTIQRELIRNKTRVAVGKDWKIIYEPIHAQTCSDGAQTKCILGKRTTQEQKNLQICHWVFTRRSEP